MLNGVVRLVTFKKRILSMILKCHFSYSQQGYKDNIIIALHNFMWPQGVGLVVSWTPAYIVCTKIYVQPSLKEEGTSLDIMVS